MRILDQLTKILLTPLAKLASTPEVLRLRAEMIYWRKRLDDLEASVDARFANMRREFYAELKKLELRVEEAERRNHILGLRVQALEKELHKLPSMHPSAESLDNKIGLA